MGNSEHHDRLALVADLPFSHVLYGQDTGVSTTPTDTWQLSLTK